jgi:hypothetical protein
VREIQEARSQSGLNRSATAQGSLKGRSSMGEEHVEDRPLRMAHGAALLCRESCHSQAQNIRVPSVMLISFVSASSSL